MKMRRENRRRGGHWRWRLGRPFRRPFSAPWMNGRDGFYAWHRGEAGRENKDIVPETLDEMDLAGIGEKWKQNDVMDIMVGRCLWFVDAVEQR